MYTISTCGWCKKTKKLLKSLDVEYKYVDIDECSEKERERVEEELEEYNSAMSTLTMVIDEGNEVIVGFKEDRIKEILSDES